MLLCERCGQTLEPLYVAFTPTLCVAIEVDKRRIFVACQDSRLYAIDKLVRGRWHGVVVCAGVSDRVGFFRFAFADRGRAVVLVPKTGGVLHAGAARPHDSRVHAAGPRHDGRAGVCDV